AHDYRYFPDPDLVPVEVSDEWLEAIRGRIGELPAARRQRFIDQYALAPADAEILAGDRALADFYERATAAGADAKRAGNLLINVVAQIANKANRPIADAGITAEQVAEVAKLIDADKLAASAALPLFERLAAGEASGSVEQTAQALGLIQSSDT